MSLASSVTDIWKRFQGELFPGLVEEVGELHTNHRRLVAVLDMVGVEGFVGARSGGSGRPAEDRAALARAFIAKAVWDFPTTRDLMDRVACDPVLRRLCGWSRVGGIPSEATFSRAFGEFARSRLPQRMHEAVVKAAFEETIVGHISRDSTAIASREKSEAKVKDETAKRKRGRPRRGEEAKRPSRLQRQLRMDRDTMLDDLPTAPTVGSKKNAKGFVETWRGYKLHVDAADPGIPISCLLTSASLHDSQAAIPLATLSAERVTYLYELMDAAYDSEEIGWHSYLSGHVPIIDVNTRRNKEWKKELAREACARHCAGYSDPRKVRYNERSTVERVNSRIKDSYGGRHVRVRGHEKVFCHLMFGVLALTIDQLMRLTL